MSFPALAITIMTEDRCGNCNIYTAYIGYMTILHDAIRLDTTHSHRHREIDRERERERQRERHTHLTLTRMSTSRSLSVNTSK
jgi:hypothetical protein